MSGLRCAACLFELFCVLGQHRLIDRHDGDILSLIIENQQSNKQRQQAPAPD